MSAKLVVPGVLVIKSAQSLPATATASLYTVSGSVLVTGLLGVVTTATGATATTLALGTTNTTTSSIATATAVTSSPAGTWLAPVNSSGKGGALNVAGAAFVAAPPFIVNPFVIGAPGGTDHITWTTSATDTGVVQWYLWFVPLDADASVS